MRLRWRKRRIEPEIRIRETKRKSARRRNANRPQRLTLTGGEAVERASLGRPTIPDVAIALPRVGFP
jgi:hypothetical protein